MIDIESESLVRCPNEAAMLFPGRPNASTIWRWYKCGVRGVRLETLVVGGRRFTSREAIQRFIERTTAAVDGPRICTPAIRRRAIERANRELDLAGI
jgi:hypothetical protein